VAFDSLLTFARHRYSLLNNSYVDFGQLVQNLVSQRHWGSTLTTA